jgi:hypothetical protein
MERFKEKKTEREVSGEFVMGMLQSAQAVWPDVYAAFREVHGERFIVENHVMASFDMGLAAIAMQQQAVPNLFQAEQAKRILRWIRNLAETPGYEKYSLHELDAYDAAWRHALANEPMGLMSCIPGRLLHRWLGPRIREFTIEISGVRTDYVDPMLVAHATTVFSSLKPFWKEAAERYRIVPDDFPPDHKFGVS